MAVDSIAYCLNYPSVYPTAMAITRNINVDDLKNFSTIPIAFSIHIHRNIILTSNILTINGLIIVNIVDNDNDLIDNIFLQYCAEICITLWLWYGFLPIFAGWQIDSRYLYLSGFDWPIFYQNIYHRISANMYNAIQLELNRYLSGAGQSRDQVYMYLRSQLLKERIV
ncbi:hypothetical protein [Herpetosiphon gulosus]|uniref:Uncharacterized protein n=1 Tax=Herpetosiphon gulosus TaxID=1973496 RepID=A0ABP9X7V9_9CHLR